jgi:hypothetical protein
MYDSTPERWKMPVEIGLDILRRGGVEHSFIDHHFGEEILFSGEKKLI